MNRTRKVRACLIFGDSGQISRDPMDTPRRSCVSERQRR